MLKAIPQDWIDSTGGDPFADIRVYIDPRGVEYPVLSGAPSYTAVSGAYNKPGSYVETASLTYLFRPGTTFSAEILYENVSGGTADSDLIELIGGYTLTLKHVSTGGYSLSAVGGTTVTCTGGTTQPCQRVGFSFVYGGDMKLYVDGALVDSDTAPALTTSPVFLRVNGDANSQVSYVRFFDGYAASAADFASNWEHVGNEEIYFYYGGATAHGRTRCNVDRSGNHLVTGYTIDRPSGYKAASATVQLNNLSGEFSDDQFAAYDPSAGSYNGTAAQNYLARRVGLEIETWAPVQTPLYPATDLYPSTTLYPSGITRLPEPLFRGWVLPGGFSRRTRNMDLSTVSLSADDAVADIGRKLARKSHYWENYHLADSTGSSSVFHSIARLATQREVTNYLTNAGFENATIGNSWAGNATFARDSGTPLVGTYNGKFTGTDKYIYQHVSFASGEDTLTVRDVFHGSIWVYATSAIQGKLKIEELSGTVTIEGSTEESYTHGGKGWERWTVSHTLTDAASTKVSLVLTSVGAWTDVPVDCATLKRGGQAEWWVANTADGSSGVSTASQAVTGTYDWVGIDVDTVAYHHPWAWIQKGENVWDNLKELAAAVCARVMRIDASGVLRMRSGIVETLPASSGTMAAASAISGAVGMGPNSFALKGAKIVKSPNLQCVWTATASSLAKEAGAKGDVWERTMANGDTIPDSTLDGTSEYEAVYGTT